jgi:hypothetical protein
MNRILRGLAGVLTAVGLLAGAMAMTGSVSSASSLAVLSTTTSISVSAGTITDQNQPITFSSVVDLEIVHGLLITPSGSVSYSAVDPNGNKVALGSGTLTKCLLGLPAISGVTTATCNASYTSEALTTDGTWTITANYSASSDLVAKPSTSAPITVLVIPGESSSCANQTACNLTVYNDDGTANVNIYMYNDSGSTQNVYAGFGSPQMTDCPGGNTLTDDTSTQNALVDSTGPDQKDILYSLSGNAGMDEATTLDPLCYGSPAAFAGSVYNAANKEYEGVLPSCNTIDDGSVVTNPPCANGYYIDGYPHDNWHGYVVAAGGIDPSIGHH